MTPATTTAAPTGDLRRRRQTLALSPAALAGALGVHPTSVLRWERRERLPGPAHIRRLAAALGLSTPQVAGFFDAARAPAPATRRPGPRTATAPGHRGAVRGGAGGRGGGAGLHRLQLGGRPGADPRPAPRAAGRRPGTGPDRPAGPPAPGTGRSPRAAAPRIPAPAAAEPPRTDPGRGGPARRRLAAHARRLGAGHAAAAARAAPPRRDVRRAGGCGRRGRRRAGTPRARPARLAPPGTCRTCSAPCARGAA